MKRKAIALLSGGLDSTLAVKIILQQGIEVEAVNFITPFCACSRTKGCQHEAKRVTESFGIPLKVFNIFEEYMEVVKKPKYGYGKGMNPCIDCRILMFRKAKSYMAEAGASFVITGEVLGQRPMSQYRRAMEIIERDSGLERLILRPLSAKLFAITLPEEKGWVDREQLLNISGRSRKPQINLAENLQINEYPCAAGGCLLTDTIFARKMKDLLAHTPCPTLNDIQLLKTGRHFRLSKELKAVVGRNEEENKRLFGLLRHGDASLEVRDANGPVVICRGIINHDCLLKAAAICARYSDNKGESEVLISGIPLEQDVLSVCPIDDSELERLRI
ncbi:MAG: hypothetical protein AAB110_05965 [Candidatus Desantisbacteria bacterium]